MTRFRSFASTEPYRSSLCLLQVILLVGFSIPPRASAMGNQRRAAVNAAPSKVTAEMSAAAMKAYQLHTKLSLAAKAAISKLNPPSEFSRIKSQFEEPLIATGPTSPKEDAELFKALKLYRDRAVEDDFSSLKSFIKGHPKSPWRMALMTNLGLAEYHYGYHSQAIDTFEETWEEGRNLKSPEAKPIVDRAVGELARMHARLGHADRLETLFKEIGDRPVAGQATEAITGAREGLWVMRNQPGEAYLCGPFGLKNLLAATNKLTPENLKAIQRYQSGAHGVTLSQLDDLASRLNVAHRIVYRTASQPVPIPSVVHWKVNHFAAILGEENGRFHVKDPTFGGDLWITRAALDSEATGFFLIPESAKKSDWRNATPNEARKVWGMGVTSTNDPGSTLLEGDVLCIPCLLNSAANTLQQVLNATAPPVDLNQHMAGYNMHEMVVSLHITDTPVGYQPPVGPGVFTTIVYNQREASQPATFTFFNIGQKWTTNWTSYITDDPRSAGANVTRAAAGGGTVDYAGYNAATGAFTPETRNASILVRVSASPVVYHRQLQGGGMEIYSQSDGAASYPRKIFLTQILDPAGNAVALHYDSTLRLTSVTDATGRDTTFSYGLAGNPLLLTQITDPFGRSAQIAYNSSGLPAQITDTLGIKSQFSYDSSGLVDAMTTPYGTTSFVYGSNGNQRYLQITDPLGHTERLEYAQNIPSLPYSDPANTIPVGLPAPFNAYLYGRDSFYWDKHTFALYGANYTKARNRHWTHMSSNTSVTNHTVESINNPLEHRIWMYYPGESSTGFSGTYDHPSIFGRVLDDGTTQLYQRTFNTLGHETDIIDPLDRETQITYAANNIDPLVVKQKTSASGFSTIAQFTWNSQHLPLSYTDAAAQTTNYQYNAAGQLMQVTDALGETTSYTHDSIGYLLSITNANGQTQQSFTRDALGRIATATDSEGYTVSYLYDAFDRVTLETFPDQTTRKYAYANLDLASVTDRQGNVTKYLYDGVRNLVQMTDPLGNNTKFGYYENQVLKSLADPNGNTTTWAIDLQNRPVGKQYANGTQITTTFENTTARVKSITDALGQVKTFTYYKDDMLSGMTYTNSVNSTPNVAFTYDAYFSRIASMTDGSGTTNYSYYPTGVFGALKLQNEATPFTNGTIAHGYDELGRLALRTVDASSETFAYDKLSRLTTHGTPLGVFNLGYLGQTRQLVSQQISTGTVGTSWVYESNLNDRKLKAINNSGATRSFNFTTTPENLITQIQEITSNGSAWAPKTWGYAYDDGYRLTQASSSAGTYTYRFDPSDNITSFQLPIGSTAANYNALNEISNYGSQTFIYDKNGNVLDDGLRTYSWDAENRLLSVTSKSNSSLKTTFKYDGIGRRIAIDTGNGALTTETRYLWCRATLCQARTSANTVSRRYYPEGEYLPLGGTSLYYSQDQLGSVRDALATQNGSRIATFDYDPYGNPIQSSGRISTDFRYAGLFYDQQDGLYLTQFRVYDPKTAKWLSRDPGGENGGINLYEYVNANTISYVDMRGLTYQSKYDGVNGPPPGTEVIETAQLEAIRAQFASAVSDPRLADQNDPYHYKAWWMLPMLSGGCIFSLPPIGDLPFRYLLQIPGDLQGQNGNWYGGIYEYVMVPGSGGQPPSLTHARFIKNGVVTGYPNQ